MEKMIFGISILIIIAAILIGIYAYGHIKRVLSFYQIKTDKKPLKIVLILTSIVIAFTGISMWRIGAVIVLHWMACAIILDIIQYIIRKGKKQKTFIFWDKLYGCGIIPIIITVLVLIFGYWNIMNVVEKNYTVTTEKDIRTEGYRAVLLSDLHLGTTLNEEQLKKVCKRIESTNPDFVILCGDISDERTSKEQLENGISILASISNKYGIYYVYGNHDRGTYRKNADFTAKDLKLTLQKNNITIVKDKAVKINDEITFVGREDIRASKDTKRKSQESLLAKIDSDSFILLADHQPVELEKNNEYGVDLQVSGHTHGGQVFPVGILSDLLGFGELNYGYKKMEHLQVIVTSGIGGWGYPVRTGHHSEYVVIDIAKK